MLAAEHQPDRSITGCIFKALLQVGTSTRASQKTDAFHQSHPPAICTFQPRRPGVIQAQHFYFLALSLYTCPDFCMLGIHLAQVYCEQGFAAMFTGVHQPKPNMTGTMYQPPFGRQNCQRPVSEHVRCPPVSAMPAQKTSMPVRRTMCPMVAKGVHSLQIPLRLLPRAVLRLIKLAQASTRLLKHR